MSERPPSARRASARAVSARAVSARAVATRVLFRVATEDAWATPSLDAEIARAGLDRRDAGLATEITYGALRVLPRLDAALDAHLSKPGKLDPYLRAALRVGAYQLLHLSRVPPHAVVSEAVELVKRERGPRLSGVVNAVLRKIARTRPEQPSPPERIAAPAWVERAFERSLGAERAAAFLASRPLPPPLGLRASGASPSEQVSALEAAHPEAQIGLSRLASRGLWVRGAGDPRALSGYTEGRLAVQEIGSQIVVELVGAEPHHRVADLCAGHGTKSLALAERAASVVAIDLYEEKLERAERERARLGIGEAKLETMAIDLTVGTGGLDARFDRVLVDAPCTGLGTLHRRPELLLRLGPGDAARLATLQLAILSSAAALVRPGGLLVYAVCSPTEEEGRGVAERFGRAHPELEPLRSLPSDPLPADPDGLVRIGPWSPETAAPDAYQVARWRRPDLA